MTNLSLREKDTAFTALSVKRELDSTRFARLVVGHPAGGTDPGHGRHVHIHIHTRHIHVHSRHIHVDTRGRRTHQTTHCNFIQIDIIIINFKYIIELSLLPVDRV